MTTFTPDRFADALEKFGAELWKPVSNGMRAGLRRAERQAEELFKSRGIGRSIFGAAEARWKAQGVKGKKDGARALIGVQRVQVLRGKLMGGLYATGLAALQEAGGRTRPHKIPRGVNGPTKVLKIGSRFVTVMGSGKFTISHPGGNVPKHPAMEPAVRQGAPTIASEIDKRIVDFIFSKGMR